MAREMDAQEWYAWYPVVTEEDRRLTWRRTVWCRKEYLGPRTARLGDPDWLLWRYYKEKPADTRYV